MSFVVRNTTGSTVLIIDLGQNIEGGQEFDLKESKSFEEIQASSNLSALLGAGTLERLDGFGGSVIPAADAFNDAVLPHSESHENNGNDEVSLNGLSGVAGDDQNPASHVSTHQSGGSDPLNVGGLAGELADPQPPKTHAGTHDFGASDPIAGDNIAIAYSPSNYTGGNTLANHLAGLDTMSSGMSKVKLRAYSGGISTTTSLTFQTKVSIPSTALPAGTYILTVSYGWNHDATNSDFEAEIRQNGSRIGELHKQEPKDAGGGGSTGTTQRYYVTRRQELVLTAGSYSFDVRYRTDDSDDESSIWEAMITVEEQ